MNLPLAWTPVTVDDITFELFIPEAEKVLHYYRDNKDNAYWAQVWPASLGLCSFLNQHQALIKDKLVLELAAGTGLPGLFIAPVAKQVTITDKEKLAVDCVQQSVKRLQMTNVFCHTLDWNDASGYQLPQVVLLSDVNYNPDLFEGLEKTIRYYLAHNITVIISTPQRLVAKAFITSLLPFCREQWNTTIKQQEKETAVTVFVLKN